MLCGWEGNQRVWCRPGHLSQAIHPIADHLTKSKGKMNEQTDNNTRSSDVVTLARPSPASFLKVTDRSFQYASPHLWNQLPSSLREPVSPLYSYLNPSFSSPLSHPSPLHSFTLNSKLTFLENLFPNGSLTIDTSD